MKKILCLVFAAILLLAGCSGGNSVAISGKEQGGNEKYSDTSKSGYAFKYKDVTIYMNDKADAIVNALGKPLEYFEAKSCAFDGLDKTYYYGGFELHTYPMNNIDYVSSILFTDDSVSTAEGICLGSSLDNLLKAYGDGYAEENGAYTYTSGKSKLSFIIEDNAVASIEYIAIVDK